MRKVILYMALPVVAVIFLVVLSGYFGPSGVQYATVEGRVVDKLSQGWVWGVQITVGGKTTSRYVSETYYLDEIKPGSYTLVAIAPNYYQFKKDVILKEGTNVVDISIEGREIPGLEGIEVFTSTIDEGIELEIVFLDSEWEIIKRYPCLPLRLEGTLFLDVGRVRSEKGRKVFEGPIELFWDTDAALGNNKGIIPWEKIDIKREDEDKEKKVIILKDYGILELILHTPQGDFKQTRMGVPLFQVPEG
ncbi:carboxypeptidase regulatory-like domain-containing protein [Candidatus Aerophobetes bacterium]|nr:carboxypeptidase regulatory-like domain-containing protein [Candidatus Aerophobetes bacterium]